LETRHLEQALASIAKSWTHSLNLTGFHWIVSGDFGASLRIIDITRKLRLKIDGDVGARATQS
jgi:hypothetical protein